MNSIKEEIRKVLPALLDNDVKKVLTLLQDELGVDGIEDLQHVKDSDFTTVLKPVQARKLLKAWRQKDREASSGSSSDLNLSTSVFESLSQCSSSSVKDCGDGWDFNLSIPWSSFSKSLLADCEDGKRPEKQARLQMVRIVVDKVYKLKKIPKLKDMERIASRIVSKYPESFRDEIDGVVIGTGIKSLATQLMYRSNNCNRNLKKLSISVLDNATNIDDNEDKIAYLKSAYLVVDRDNEKIQQLMNLTFKEQRDDIEKKPLIKLLKDEWPFLFEEKYLLNHYETLMCESNFKENFVSNIKERSVTIFK